MKMFTAEQWEEFNLHAEALFEFLRKDFNKDYYLTLWPEGTAVFHSRKREKAARDQVRNQALALIEKERERQDAKWGEQNHAPQYWVGILGEEYGEYCQAVNETVFDNGKIERLKGGTDNMITELTHVAAVAVSAIECLLREGELLNE
jgi:hypothetical protein